MSCEEIQHKDAAKQAMVSQFICSLPSQGAARSWEGQGERGGVSGRVIPGERLSTAHFAKAVQTELRIRPASTFLMSLSTTLQTTPRFSSPTLPPLPSLLYTYLSSPHAINSKLTTFCCLIQQDFDEALETGINFSRYLIRDF